jgi:carbonic anhydrase/acetyltransferase-like protein (isoleucine patch superfamily)
MVDRIGIRGKALAKEPTDALVDPWFKFNDTLSRHRTIMPLLRRGTPQVDPVAFIAPCSSIIGSVVIGSESSIWYGAVLRGDNCDMAANSSKEDIEDWKSQSEEQRTEHLREGWQESGGGIFIGSGTNIQDGCIVTSRLHHTKIGNGVTVGHGAHIHSATVDDGALIGMGCILNPGVHVEEGGFVAAGAVVIAGTTIPSGELWVGNPARKLRDLRREEKERLGYQAQEYVKKGIEQSDVMEIGGNLDSKDIRNAPISPGSKQDGSSS